VRYLTNAGDASSAFWHSTRMRMICTILKLEEETNCQRRLLGNIASDQTYQPHYQVQRHCAIGFICNKPELPPIYLEEDLHSIVQVLRIFLVISAIRRCISSCVILSHSSCRASFISSSESKILRRKRCFTIAQIPSVGLRSGLWAAWSHRF
jgi:hypothetical protein